MPKSRIAIFVDAENIAARHWREVADHAAATGTLNLCQIFGDFTEDRLGRWLDVARTEGLQPVLQLSGGKNSSDIAMTVAAMDALHAGRVEAIYIVSSDRDFAPLIRRLRAAGLKVFGFGLANTPESLRMACTAFVVLGADAEVAKFKAAAG
ncbi:MAG TPA: NYN domain-containing protein [Devosia sp.]|nr:NYN domain-containing protein [Devosia sp.]